MISSIISRSCGERTDSWPFEGKRELDAPKTDDESDVDVCGFWRLTWRRCVRARTVKKKKTGCEDLLGIRLGSKFVVYIVYRWRVSVTVVAIWM